MCTPQTTVQQYRLKVYLRDASEMVEKDVAVPRVRRKRERAT